MKKFKKSAITDFILGVVLTLLVLIAFLTSWRPLEKLEYGIYDLNARLREKNSMAPTVVVAIDEQSIANIGRWPWPRSYIASIVDLLQSYNVKVVIISPNTACSGLLKDTPTAAGVSPGIVMANVIVGSLLIITRHYLLTEKTGDSMVADGFETNKMLGLSFQGQGLLDMAFDKFRKCPVEEESAQELLYNLGLDFEKKRMFNKAVAVYEHIARAANSKDVHDRIKKLNAAGQTIVFGRPGARKEATQTGKSLVDDLLACSNKEA